MNVTFLHGLGQTSESWMDTIALLPDSVQAECVDLFQFRGEICYPNLYRAFEQNCGTKTVHLCGLSLGAVAALNYAVGHSQQVGSLVLIAPQYKMPRFLLGVQNLIFRFLPDQAFAETGLSKRDMLRLTNSMAELDFRQGLERISCPVLIICGENDRANRKSACALAEKIPGAKLQILDDAGHEVNKDAPVQLAAVLSSFYEKM